jgi:hypothetical protein
MTKVTALEKGHDGTEIREAGEVFDVDLTDKRYSTSTWFLPVDQAPQADPEGKKAERNPRPAGQGPKPGSAAKGGATVGDIA